MSTSMNGTHLNIRNNGNGVVKHGAANVPHQSILVVEDDFETQQMMKDILRNEYCVLTAKSAREAMDILENSQVDLVLMDMMLHESESGLELTRRIRHRWPQQRLPIIALTAHAFKAQGASCIAAGCDDYVTKPFHIVELRQLLRRHIDAVSHSENPT
ncbi:MAG: response regulator [Ignavibacteriae bacterium]|nr:response regulator [Ignavibacteriota bacterium]